MRDRPRSHRHLLLALGMAALSPLLFAFLCYPLIPSLPPSGGPTPAAVFAPTVSADVSNPTPGAASDIVTQLSFPAGSTLAAGAQFQIPAGWTVANDADVVDGSLAGSIAGYMTVADQFIAIDCTTTVSFDPGAGTQIDLMEATTATGTTVPGYDTDGDGKPEAVEDNNGDGLADGVTAYPAFLTSLLPGTHKARYFGHVEAAGLSELFVTILVDEVSPGGPYQVITIVNDPTSPPESATGQFCAPQSMTLTLLGTSADNPATGTVEGNQNLYTNPATSGGYTFDAVLVSEFDNDNDGTSNGLDNCPATANATQTDSDEDYVGNACETDAVQDFDVDGDGLENSYDNCIFVANSATLGPNNQTDADFDDIGDACDSNPSVPDGPYYYLNCSDPVGIGQADPGGASCTAGAPTPGPPTATPTPCNDPLKPACDGNVSGVYDLEVLGGPNTIYHCVSRFDHDASDNAVKANTVCYSDIEIGDPNNLLSGVNVPGEGPDGGGPGNQGPPVPPPYTNLEPFKGWGSYDTGLDEVTFDACIARTGAGALGPNLNIRVTLTGMKTGDVSTGTAELYAGANNKDCDNLSAPTGGAPLPLRATKATAAVPVAWRTSATDLDGDGCTDSDELAKPNAIPKGCGDDPYNPTDSNQTDFSGAYSIAVEVTRADLNAGGSYFSCLADIQQTGTGKTDGDLVARAFCYTDGSLLVNSIGYPTTTGDGFPGGGPAWGALEPCENVSPFACGPAFVADAEDFAAGECARFNPVDDDLDGTINDGCPEEGLGDTDSKQTVLTGYVDNGDNTIKLRGCFEDEDASTLLIHTYVELVVNRNTGIGTVDIWPLQDLADCIGSYAWGTYSGIGGLLLPDFDNADVSMVRQPGGQDRDTDQDGASDAEELRDDGANCGLRDPFNPYDWYDVNAQDVDPDPNVEEWVAAPDGVIDLANDILGVIQHYSPAGAPPYDEIWDRGKPITGGAGNWSREAPDGVIDLANDILGVIQQYHPGPCT